MMNNKPLNKETSEFFMKMTDDLLNKLICCDTEEERIQSIQTPIKTAVSLKNCWAISRELVLIGSWRLLWVRLNHDLGMLSSVCAFLRQQNSDFFCQSIATSGSHLKHGH